MSAIIILGRKETAYSANVAQISTNCGSPRGWRATKESIPAVNGEQLPAPSIIFYETHRKLFLSSIYEIIPKDR
jgi:hypothetical protein